MEEAPSSEMLVNLQHYTLSYSSTQRST